MRHYEMMLIISDTLEEEDAQGVFDRAKTVLSEQGGQLNDEAWWGKRRFAYEIAKRNHGWYGVLDFQASSEGLTELERQLSLRDDVVRFKTVRPEIRVKKPG
jgi:small subunit ribosomal protein S6